MIARVAVAATAALALAGCGATGDDEPSAQGSPVDVYAAASLTQVFTQLAEEYESTHTGVQIRLTFAGSSDLAAQIREGAPADVFASANERQMANVDEHIDGESHPFASNSLIIAVPQGNPAGITDLASLAHPDVAVVVCAPQVPCGAAAVALEDSQGVTLSPVSELSNVTDVLGSVASGEADAGLVYVTDIPRAQGVSGIPIAHADASVTSYPIAVMTSGDARDAARGFVDYVLSRSGQATLAASGFAAPRAAGGR